MWDEGVRIYDIPRVPNNFPFQNRDNDHLKWNSLMIKTLCYTWLINPNIILYEYFRK